MRSAEPPAAATGFPALNPAQRPIGERVPPLRQILTSTAYLLLVLFGFLLLHDGLISFEESFPVVRMAAAALLAVFVSISFSLLLDVRGGTTAGPYPLLLAASIALVPFTLHRQIEGFLLATRLICLGLVVAATLHAAAALISHWRNQRPVRLGQVLIVCLIPVVFFAWSNLISIPPTGDQGHVLLLAYSIGHDGDLDLTNNYRRQDSLTFMPESLKPQTFDPNINGQLRSRHSPVLAALALPGLLLGGWVGAGLTFALIMAALAIVIFASASRCAPPEYALAATLAAIASPPLVLYAGLVYSEVPGALLAAAALHLALSRRTAGTTYLSISLLAVSAYFLKPRFALLIIPLAPILLMRQRRRRPVLLILLTSALVTVVLGLYTIGLGGTPLAGHSFDDILRTPWIRLLIGPLGLLLDQQYGALFYAPLFLIAPLGLLQHVRNQPRDRRAIELLAPLFVILPYVLVIACFAELIGGICPQPRFMLAVMVLISPYLAPALQWLERQRAASFSWLLTIITAAWTITQFCLPHLSLPYPGETNAVLAATGLLMGLPLAELFPSFDRPSPHDLVIIGGIVLLAAGFVYAAIKLPGLRRLYRGRHATARGFSMFAVLSILILIAAKAQRPTRLQMEDAGWSAAFGTKTWNSTQQLVWPYQVAMWYPIETRVMRKLSLARGVHQLAVHVRVQPASGIGEFEVLVNGAGIGGHHVMTDRWRSYVLPFETGEDLIELELRTKRGRLEFDRIEIDPGPVESALAMALEPADFHLDDYIHGPLYVEFFDSLEQRLEDLIIGEPRVQYDPVSRRVSVSFTYRRDRNVQLVEMRRLDPVNLVLQAGPTRQTMELELANDSGRKTAEFKVAAELGGGEFAIGLTAPSSLEQPLHVSSISPFLGGALRLGTITAGTPVAPSAEPPGEPLIDLPEGIHLDRSTYLRPFTSVTLPIEPPVTATAVMLETALIELYDLLELDQTIGEVTIDKTGGDSHTFPLRVGLETGERDARFPGVAAILAHPMAPVLRRWPGIRGDIRFEQQSYYCILELDHPTTVQGIRFSRSGGAGVLAVYSIRIIGIDHEARS
ncbi:hypothetical protein JW905_04140 [bacterium]|nr:hypothetical protein [candidate division CSSED10-310 bacterium]